MWDTTDGKSFPFRLSSAGCEEMHQNMYNEHAGFRKHTLGDTLRPSWCLPKSHTSRIPNHTFCSSKGKFLFILNVLHCMMCSQLPDELDTALKICIIEESRCPLDKVTNYKVKAEITSALKLSQVHRQPQYFLMPHIISAESTGTEWDSTGMGLESTGITGIQWNIPIPEEY